MTVVRVKPSARLSIFLLQEKFTTADVKGSRVERVLSSLKTCMGTRESRREKHNVTQVHRQREHCHSCHVRERARWKTVHGRWSQVKRDASIGETGMVMHVVGNVMAVRVRGRRAKDRIFFYGRAGKAPTTEAKAHTSSTLRCGGT